MMKRGGFLSAVAVVALLSFGCATTEKPRTSANPATTPQTQAEATKDPTQKRIDAKVDKIEQERRSKFRLNSLFGRR